MSQLTILSEQELEQLRTQYKVAEGAEHCPKVEAINALLDTVKARDLLSDKLMQDFENAMKLMEIAMGQADE